MGESPDQILNSYGPLNPYILMIFFITAAGWAITSLPLMASAFLLGDVCGISSASCKPTAGTISEEFNLVGERAKFADLTTSAFLLGNALGASPITYLSDRKGRRAVIILSMTLFGIFGVVSSLSTSVYMFMALRLCQGAFFPGCGVVDWVHAYENTPVSIRKYAPLVFGLMWVLGYCTVTPLAYFLPNWRHLMIASSSPSLAWAVLLYFVVPDSFHFLVSKENKDGLTRWLMNANKVSRIPRSDLTADVIIDAHRQNHKHPPNMSIKNVILELLKRRILIIYLLILAYIWTCDAFVYYGISLISTLLSGAGSKYWSYALTGMIEIPSCILSPFLLDLIGRRLFVSLTHLLTAISFLGIMFVKNETLSLVLWLIGKFGISCAFTALFVYASEIFPTVVRSSCIGVCIVVSQVGGILAPFTRLMTAINPNLQKIVFIVGATVAALLTLILPETKNRELPDSMDEAAGTKD